jgi:hypothetical protein
MLVSELNGLVHQFCFNFENTGWHNALSLEANEVIIRPTLNNILDGRFAPRNAKLGCRIGVF